MRFFHRTEPMPDGIQTQDFISHRLGPAPCFKGGGVQRSTGRAEVAAIMLNYRLSQGLVLERYGMATVPASPPLADWRMEDGKRVWG